MAKLGQNLILPRCPYCGVDNPNLDQVTHFETQDFKGDDQRRWACYKCGRCGGVTLAWCVRADGSAAVREYYPSVDTVNEAIPDRAREYLEQALNSLAAPAGAVMLAASSVDAMLKIKGYEEGTLFSRIDKAASDGEITKDMASWAHEVRLDANDQRHADSNASLPTPDEARQTIDFAKALAQFMFVLPSRVTRGLAEAKGDS